MSSGLKFESKDHRVCWFKCGEVLSDLKKEIRDEARKSKKDGLPGRRSFHNGLQFGAK